MRNYLIFQSRNALSYKKATNLWLHGRFEVVEASLSSFNITSKVSRCNLRELYFSNSIVNESDLKFLTKTGKLESIQFHGTPIISSDGEHLPIEDIIAYVPFANCIE